MISDSGMLLSMKGFWSLWLPFPGSFSGCLCSEDPTKEGLELGGLQECRELSCNA